MELIHLLEFVHLLLNVRKYVNAQNLCMCVCACELFNSFIITEVEGDTLTRIFLT